MTDSYVACQEMKGKDKLAFAVYFLSFTFFPFIAASINTYPRLYLRLIWPRCAQSSKSMQITRLIPSLLPHAHASLP